VAVIGEFVGGAGLLVRGLGLITRRPRLFLLGALPPLITSVFFLALLITLIGNLHTLIPFLASFSDSWLSGLHLTMEIAIGIALVGGSILIMVLVFTSITLLIGAPAYDKIAELAEVELGNVPAGAATGPVLRSVARSVRQSLALIAVSLLGAVMFALLGFIPVAGQTLIPVLSAIFGSWLLCIELLSPAFERRGLVRIADRRGAMGRHRLRTLGFAIPAFLLLAIPFVSVLVFPAATAGGTMLARELLPNDERLC
jgi:CysZ protein